MNRPKLDKVPKQYHIKKIPSKCSQSDILDFYQKLLFVAFLNFKDEKAAKEFVHLFLSNNLVLYKEGKKEKLLTKFNRDIKKSI